MLASTVNIILVLASTVNIFLVLARTVVFHVYMQIFTRDYFYECIVMMFVDCPLASLPMILPTDDTEPLASTVYSDHCIDGQSYFANFPGRRENWLSPVIQTTWEARTEGWLELERDSVAAVWPPCLGEVNRRS